ncbi:DUF3343 domain-containing protein [Clostridium hydrogeniformans]|uniref:DUF3343 domain-containing protein n=1 Tax=Clostridium hydrogeniformans TaxID=349933 RepID=UPI00048615AE|nr:DUF3343 domain-containing protein [Clostridium hydrogeniformans]
MREYCLLVFKNTHDAIQGEKLLKSEGLKVTIMPTPTYITKSCGISVKFDTEDIDLVKSLVQSEKLIIKNMYHKNEEEFQVII